MLICYAFDLHFFHSFILIQIREGFKTGNRLVGQDLGLFAVGKTIS